MQKSCPEDQEFEAKTAKNDNSTTIHDYEYLMKTISASENVMIELETDFRSLNHIASRGNIRHDTVAIQSDDKLFQNLSDLTNIPHNVRIDDKATITSQATPLVQQSLSNLDKSEMIIELMLQALNTDNINEVEYTSTVTLTQSQTKIVTLDEVILEYTFDMKQSVAFEIMCCSFLMASIQAEVVDIDIQKVTSSTSNTKSSSFYHLVRAKNDWVHTHDIQYGFVATWVQYP